MANAYRKLADQLELDILSGKIASGEQMPSLRTLAEQRKVSPDIARRALSALCDRGLLEAQHGRGFFVAATDRNHDRAGTFRIAVAYSESQQIVHGISYCARVMKGIQQEAEQQNVSLLLHYNVLMMENDGKLESLLQNAHKEVDAMILLGTYDRLPRIWDCRVPLVGVGMEHTCGGLLSPVYMDPWGAAKLAVDFFHRAKMHKIRLYQTVAAYRSSCIQTFLSAWDGDAEIEIFEWGRPFNTEMPEDLGYWVEVGGEANWIAEVYRQKTGGVLAAERNIVALDGKVTFNPTYHPMNSIFPDWEQVGRSALWEALRRLRHPGCGMNRIYADVQFRPAVLTPPAHPLSKQQGEF